MRKLYPSLAAAALSALLAGTILATADTGTLVTPSGNTPQSSTGLYGQSNGATSCNSVSQTAAQDTVTITPAANQLVVVDGVYIDIFQTDATGVSGVPTVSTTNLTGAPFWAATTVATSLQGIHMADTFPTGLKAAAPGVAVTFVPSATMGAKNILCMRVAAHFVTTN